MKKCLVSVLICLILTNFICINYCYATDVDDIKGEYTAESYERAQDGKANLKGEEVSANDTGGSIVGTVVGLYAKWIALYPMLFEYIISSTLNLGGIIGNDTDVDIFTIRNIITGRYYLLDCNVFRDKNSVTPVEKNTDLIDTLGNIRTEVAKWFIIVRDISMAINLAVLLYISIRVAIATISTEKAKYKELLYNWLLSMVILFMLPYIMVFMTEISNALVRLASGFMVSMENAGNKSFETEIINQVIDSYFSSGGFTFALYVIIFVILIWTEMKFFLMYGKRMLTVFFLIVISPIITITYSVDKIGDGKAQAFTKWMSEFLNNLFIQPIHCFTYLVFMFTANNFAKSAPLVGILFLLSLTKAEKIVKKLLNVSGNTLENVGDKFSVKGLKNKISGMVPKGGGK